MHSFTDRAGNVYLLYRAASEKIDRGTYLLKSEDVAKPFAGHRFDNWRIERCPLSPAAFAEGPKGVVAAWENDGQIFFAAAPESLPAKGNMPRSVGRGGETAAIPPWRSTKKGK